jgi:hypothetical protein
MSGLDNMTLGSKDVARLSRKDVASIAGLKGGLSPRWHYHGKSSPSTLLQRPVALYDTKYQPGRNSNG